MKVDDLLKESALLSMVFLRKIGWSWPKRRTLLLGSVSVKSSPSIVVKDEVRFSELYVVDELFCEFIEVLR